MRLRALELANVRRFAGQRVRVQGIGDGVSVLAAPNEAGKSTLFDGLQALMFQRHGATGKEIRALRPHSGGAVQVAAEVETEAGRFRVEKRWLSRAQARVLDAAGRVLAQDDAAEAWIERLAGGGLSGPAGLLWVRQGQAGLASAGTLAARRDLLSSVAGEIEAMTGGRRMDAVRARVEAGLAGLATATGRPRAGGAWEAALKEAEGLDARAAELRGRAARLSEALAARRRAERRRAELDDPQALAESRARLATAEAEAAAASDHARRLAEARQALALAEAQRAAAGRDRDRLAAQAAEAETAARLHASAISDRARAEAAETEARAAAEAGARAAADAEAELRDARARLRAAEGQARAAAARARAGELAARLERAEAQAEAATRAHAERAGLPVTPRLLQAAEAAAERLGKLRAQAEAQAVALRFDYTGPARARRDGAPVEGVLRLTEATALDLPGLGRLSIDPGSRAGDDLPGRLASARADLDRALAACGATALPEARAALRQATELEDAARLAADLVAALVPEGLEALRGALARARIEAEALPEGEAGDPAARAAEVESAEAAQRAAGTRAATLRERLAGAASAHAAARATAAALAERAEAAQAALAPPEAHAQALAAAEAETVRTASAATDARRLAEALAGSAPDAETVAAALARARGALQALTDEGQALDRQLAELQGQIGTLAGEGIEEDLAETEGRLAEARRRAEVHGAEVAALTRLRAALDAARAAARETYFEPVAREIGPLLALLHPGAALRLGDASLLPEALARAGVDEALDTLSGGTQEQIAVLTRLAFARLFAKRGQPVPVILDDALVQTDDERIEAMFTALHRTAQGQQVIVLTCRQRAFAALGGQRLEMTVEPLG